MKYNKIGKNLIEDYNNYNKKNKKISDVLHYLKQIKPTIPLVTDDDIKQRLNNILSKMSKNISKKIIEKSKSINTKRINIESKNFKNLRSYITRAISVVSDGETLKDLRYYQSKFQRTVSSKKPINISNNIKKNFIPYLLKNYIHKGTSNKDAIRLKIDRMIEQYPEIQEQISNFGKLFINKVLGQNTNNISEDDFKILKKFTNLESIREVLINKNIYNTFIMAFEKFKKNRRNIQIQKAAQTYKIQKIINKGENELKNFIRNEVKKNNIKRLKTGKNRITKNNITKL